MSLTSIYYVKQDNTVWGCGDPECCGEYYEDIEEDFVKCDHDIPESEMTGDHLHGCNGGGPVLKWRKAKEREMIAFYAGQEDGFQEGWSAGEDYEKKKRNTSWDIRDKTIHDLVHLGYKITLDGSMIDKPVSVYYDEKLGGK